MVLFIIIICGFIYGRDYFRFYEPYGLASESERIGIYFLSLKWWNIEFNLYQHIDELLADIKIRFIVGLFPKKYKEYCMIFRDTGIKVCIININ